MNINLKIVLILILIFSAVVSINAQTSVKLPATNIIGTALSVDYSTNNSSTTVNTKKNVFDGNLETFFASYDRSGTWVGLDLGTKHVITKIAYAPRPDHTQRLLLAVFEGANNPDFSDAVPLLMITQSPPARVLTAQNLNCSKGFRYVRYIGPNDVRCNIAEIEFYGYEGAGSNTYFPQLTNLPTVTIHTVNAKEIDSRSNYVQGTISLIYNNGKSIYTDSLDIRGRGNYSWGFPKKPYRIKLNNKAHLLGFPAKSKSWTLISNYGDKTLIRNLLAFDLSRRFEMEYTPVGTLVDVVLNGEYKGTYQLCDHIEVATGRVEVETMNVNDIALPNLSGGYCLKIDAYYDSEDLYFRSLKNVPVSFKYPKADEIVNAQLNYIRTHYNSMETSVFASNFKDPVNGYRKYIDLESFIRYFLIGEISGNTDTYWQTFIYKKRNNDMFFWGPVWDMDLAYENDSRTYPINNNSNWIYASTGSVLHSSFKDMINRLLTDEYFISRMKAIYADYRDRGIITKETLLKVVDNYASEANQSQQLNFMRWDILNSRVHQNPRTYGSYTGEVNNVKSYISNRIDWMDKKLTYTPKPIPNVLENPSISNVIVYAEANIIYFQNIVEPVNITITDITGKIFLSKSVKDNISVPVSKGLYIVTVSDVKGNKKITKCLIP